MATERRPTGKSRDEQPHVCLPDSSAVFDLLVKTSNCAAQDSSASREIGVLILHSVIAVRQVILFSLKAFLSPSSQPLLSRLPAYYHHPTLPPSSPLSLSRACALPPWPCDEETSSLCVCIFVFVKKIPYVFYLVRARDVSHSLASEVGTQRHSFMSLIVSVLCLSLSGRMPMNYSSL